jgi:hypothetical protein
MLKMKNEKEIQMATNFLLAKRVDFSEPIYAIAIDGDTVEVVFTAPGALDPNLVVDPPDVRVRVGVLTQSVELVNAM